MVESSDHGVMGGGRRPLQRVGDCQWLPETVIGNYVGVVERVYEGDQIANGVAGNGGIFPRL